MVRIRVLNSRQREEILVYLSEKPDKPMPAYVRGLRMMSRSMFGHICEEEWIWGLAQPYEDLEMDYRQGIEDLDLLKRLALLDIQIGRKSNAFKELHAATRIRRRSVADAKAVLDVRKA